MEERMLMEWCRCAVCEGRGLFLIEDVKIACHRCEGDGGMLLPKQIFMDTAIELAA